MKKIPFTKGQFYKKCTGKTVNHMAKKIYIETTGKETKHSPPPTHTRQQVRSNNKSNVRENTKRFRSPSWL